MVRKEGLDDRGLAPRVAAEMLGSWVGIWQEVAAAQDVNPVLRAVAEAATTDPVQSIRNIVPDLARLHPAVVAQVTATCQFAVEELLRAAAAEAVSGPLYRPTREAERTFGDDGDRDVDEDEETGGGQHHDRAAEMMAELRQRMDRMETWHADLEDEVVRLRRTVVEFGAAASQPEARPANTP